MMDHSVLSITNTCNCTHSGANMAFLRKTLRALEVSTSAARKTTSFVMCMAYGYHTGIGYDHLLLR